MFNNLLEHKRKQKPDRVYLIHEIWMAELLATHWSCSGIEVLYPDSTTSTLQNMLQ